MKFVTLSLASLLWLAACAESNRGTSRCRTELTYVTNAFTQGEDALRHASVYQASLAMGSDEYRVEAIIDTASANLVINEKNFATGLDSIMGKKPYVFDNDHEKGAAVNAKDYMDVACIDNASTHFAITAKESNTANYMGLAYSDPKRHDHEAKTPSFFAQLVNNEGLEDVFSLALCGSRSSSWILLGGYDGFMESLIGNFIPIIEKTAYVVPARSIRRADTKAVLGNFPAYDPKTRSGVRTIIDSATSFLLLPTEMAENVASEIAQRADNLGILHQFPSGFFRTERSSSTKTIRFNNLVQLRQFLPLEITFVGDDGKQKALELSPLHYFKEIDTKDPLIRTFAIRETSGDVILGQPFLESHYTYFDRKNSRIGFGNSDIACGMR